MSKIVFGAYLYIVESKTYQYNPTMLGFFEKEQIELLKEPDNMLTVENENGEKLQCQIVAEHTSFISNVPYMALAIAPSSTNVTVQIHPGFSTSDALATYVDNLARNMMMHEEKWDNIVSKTSEEELKTILSHSTELCVLVNELKNNKDTYYKTIKMYSNPFVPYSKFIESFFTECNFYDILSMLERRAELFDEIKEKNRRKRI